jgi:ATPase subunit of ABC transporter with duplicated ATPase domains
MKVLEARELCYGLSSKRIFAENVNFQLNAGEVLWIQGPNGAGKSTLLRVFMQDLAPLQGEIKWYLPRERLGYLPQLQNSSLHLPLTIGDILKAAAIDSTNMIEQVNEIGILPESAIPLAWNTASGGERKRTLLTRLLLKSPQVLLLDEPTNHLDRQSRTNTARALGQWLWRDKSRALILISHDPELRATLGSAQIRELQIGSTTPTQDESEAIE